jgi:hypothetical protein
MRLGHWAEFSLTEPTEEPTAPPTPVPVVTQTVVAVSPGGGNGDDTATLFSALGSLLSGAAAVGTLLHAVRLSRQSRQATTDVAPGSAPSASS